jgi:hypothetical protein
VLSAREPSIAIDEVSTDAQIFSPTRKMAMTMLATAAREVSADRSGP